MEKKFLEIIYISYWQSKNLGGVVKKVTSKLFREVYSKEYTHGPMWNEHKLGGN